MVTIKVPISDEASYSTKQANDIPQLDANYNRRRIITLTLNEVAWLFGINVNQVEEWITSGILTPCSSTPNGSKRFWREHIAGLLAMCGA